MKTLPRRQSDAWERLPRCESLTTKGTRCTKAVVGADSLREHGLLDHPLAGKACFQHVVGRDVFRAMRKTRAVKDRAEETRTDVDMEDAGEYATTIGHTDTRTTRKRVFRRALYEGDPEEFEVPSEPAVAEPATPNVSKYSRLLSPAEGADEVRRELLLRALRRGRTPS
jgi:hypothetical protein